MAEQKGTIIVRRYRERFDRLHSVVSQINDFLRTIELDLLQCPASSLDSLLGQCMYFGQSFGRIGADFRGLVIGYFVDVVERNFETAIAGANESFAKNMQTFELSKSSLVSNINLLKESNREKQVWLIYFESDVKLCNSNLIFGSS